MVVDRRGGRVVLLEQDDGPEVLAAALAASVAWHTRAPTLCVFVDTARPAGLETLETVPTTRPFRRWRRDGFDLMLASSTDLFAPERLEHTIEELALVYDYVLLCVARSSPLSAQVHRRVRIGPFGSGGGFAVAARDHAETATTCVPPLTERELSSVAGGMLPADGAAGTAIGSVARDLAGLRVGLALGAGSIRGYAHIGGLRALSQHGVPIDCIAGTSIGAAVATAYAHFADEDRVAKFLDELGARMFRPRISRKSFLSTHAMHRYVCKTFGNPRLEDLPLPVAVVASDVETHDEIVLRRGDLATAVLASAAVPGVFPAVRIGNRTLVDGGVVNPVPVSVAASLGADVVVGIRLVHRVGSQADEVSVAAGGPVPSAVSAIIRSIELVQTRIGIVGPSIPTILITPEFGGVPPGKLRNFRDGRRYIPLGAAAVEAALPRLMATLPWLRPSPWER
jgi:NTE family protein